MVHEFYMRTYLMIVLLIIDVLFILGVWGFWVWVRCPSKIGVGCVIGVCIVGLNVGAVLFSDMELCCGVVGGVFVIC